VNVAATIAARLAGDATLTALLSTYRSAPAVLVVGDGAVPEDVGLPFIAVVADVVVDEPYDAKNAVGRDVTVPVRCYTAATGSTLALESITERVRTLLHRQPVGLDTSAFMATCSISPAPTDDSLYGREVDVRVMSL
jgi:hypothetical protein